MCSSDLVHLEAPRIFKFSPDALTTAPGRTSPERRPSRAETADLFHVELVSSLFFSDKAGQDATLLDHLDLKSAEAELTMNLSFKLDKLRTHTSLELV